MTNRSKFAPGVACDNSASIVNPIRETNAIHLSFLLDTGTVMRFAPTCLKGKSKMVAKYPRVAQFPSPAMWQTMFAPFQSSYSTPATNSPSTSLPIAVPRPGTHVPPALSQTHGPTLDGSRQRFILTGREWDQGDAAMPRALIADVRAFGKINATPPSLKCTLSVVDPAIICTWPSPSTAPDVGVEQSNTATVASS